VILLPISHEAGAVKRLPWVTFALMALCFAAFLLSGRFRLMPSDDLRVARSVEQAMAFWTAHPYLALDAEFAERVLGDTDRAGVSWMAAQRQARPGGPDNGLIRHSQQTNLDRLTAEALDALATHPLLVWGLVPDRLTAPTLVTYQFLHAGWLHIAGNLLLLFLAGPFIEDVWGRPLFLGFYLTAGVLGGLMHVGAQPDSLTPLIGASGAVSGIMGAFLVRYRRTRIRFFYLVGVFWRGTFSAPAWVMLPLWFALQLGLAMAAGHGGGGVAYWAHVGGFTFGAAAAAAMAWQGIERRLATAGSRGFAGAPVPARPDPRRAPRRRVAPPAPPRAIPEAARRVR